MAKEPLHLDFSNAETQRNRLTNAQAKSIRDLYRDASREIGKMAERAPRVPSDALRKEYLRDLQGEINRELKGIERQLDGTVRDNMTKVVQATVEDAKGFAQDVGLSIQGAYSHVPTDIVRAVASGQLYEGNWTLSKALWLNTRETQQDVQNIVAKGILENKSAYDIAKDLEKYVDPTARKDWEWSKVYPGTRKVVDYNAQRLARTMVSHAYQQAFVRTTINNPFITKYEWRAADTERTCQLCLDRDGQYFPKDDLPLDHPNGMCTFLAVIEDDFNSIADRLVDWAQGADDPALDDWAKDLYGSDWINPKQNPYSNEMSTKGHVGLSKSESDAFMDKYHNKTLLNKKSMNTMEGAQSRRINGALRKGQMPSDPKDQKFMAKLDKAIASNSIPQDMTLFRGVSLSAFKDYDAFLDFERLAKQVSMDQFRDASGKIDFDAWGKVFQTAQQQDIANLLERGKQLLGSVVEDKGFMQVSASSERNIFGFSDINLQLHVPKGTKAYISDYKEESEIILARGTKYEILGVEISTVRAENGNQMEVLQLIAQIVE